MAFFRVMNQGGSTTPKISTYLRFANSASTTSASVTINEEGTLILPALMYNNITTALYSIYLNDEVLTTVSPKSGQYYLEGATLGITVPVKRGDVLKVGRRTSDSEYASCILPYVVV